MSAYVQASEARRAVPFGDGGRPVDLALGRADDGAVLERAAAVLLPPHCVAARERGDEESAHVLELLPVVVQLRVALGRELHVLRDLANGLEVVDALDVALLEEDHAEAQHASVGLLLRDEDGSLKGGLGRDCYPDFGTHFRQGVFKHGRQVLVNRGLVVEGVDALDCVHRAVAVVLQPRLFGISRVDVGQPQRRPTRRDAVTAF